MTLKELQQKAHSLGLPYSRRTSEELEVAIAAHESTPQTDPEVQEEIEQAESPEGVSPAPVLPDIDPRDYDEENVLDNPLPEPIPATVALVLNKDGNEVRRFELAVHGEGFGVLAKEFATKNGYTAQLK